MIITSGNARSRALAMLSISIGISENDKVLLSGNDVSPCPNHIIANLLITPPSVQHRYQPPAAKHHYRSAKQRNKY